MSPVYSGRTTAVVMEEQEQQEEQQEVAKEKEKELVEQEHIFHYNTTVHSAIFKLKAQYSGLRISTVVRAALNGRRH